MRFIMPVFAQVLCVIYAWYIGYCVGRGRWEYEVEEIKEKIEKLKKFMEGVKDD